MTRLKSKYKLLWFLPFLLLLIDGVWHKGLVRVMIGKSFSSKVYAHLKPTLQQVNVIGLNQKIVPKAVNSSVALTAVDINATCVEIDVYIDTLKKDFAVYHHKELDNGFTLSQFIVQRKIERRPHTLWLDIKNLDSSNFQFALSFLNKQRDSFKLTNRIIVESSNPSALSAFTRAGYFTCYYTPSINPYIDDANTVDNYVNEIAKNVAQYKVCALSGYYFQTSLLKHSFPNYPILQWQTNDKFSAVNWLYNKRVAQDSHILLSCY